MSLAGKEAREHDKHIRAEELLREAELKGLERFHPDYCYAAKKDDRVRFSWPCCGIGKRIAELEKARTSAEKP